jgi:hypothetical protein
MKHERVAVGMEPINRPASAAPAFMRQQASASKQAVENEEEQDEKEEKAVVSALPQLDGREIGIGGLAQVVAISNHIWQSIIFFGVKLSSLLLF